MKSNRPKMFTVWSYNRFGELVTISAPSYRIACEVLAEELRLSEER